MFRRFFNLIAIPAVASLAGVVLYRQALQIAAGRDWQDPLGAFGSLDTEQAVALTASALGVLICVWLAITTVLYAGATAANLPRLASVIAPVMLPHVRMLVDGAVAGAITLTSLSGVTSPTAAQDQVVETVTLDGYTNSDSLTDAGIHTALNRLGTTATRLVNRASAEWHTLQPGESVEQVATRHLAKLMQVNESSLDVGEIRSYRDQVMEANTHLTSIKAGGSILLPSPVDQHTTNPSGNLVNAAASRRSGAGGSWHTVQPGDNLWRLATHKLAAATGLPPQELGHDEITAYWQRLVQANASSLASGDPDLIRPGETLLLPPVFSETPSSRSSVT